MNDEQQRFIDTAHLVNDVAIMNVLHWLVERTSVLAKERGDMLLLLRHQMDTTRKLVEDLNGVMPHVKPDNDT